MYKRQTLLSAPDGAWCHLRNLFQCSPVGHYTVENIANITRYSHIASRNTWLGRTAVNELRVHVIIVCSLTILPCYYDPSPYIYTRQFRNPARHHPAFVRRYYTVVRYFYSPHPGTTTNNCYFRGTEVALVPAAADEGCIASRTENGSTWYAIPRTWRMIWLLLCCCCRCLQQQDTTAAAARQHCCFG